MADVTLRKVVKRYDEVEAVRGIDLDIADHEFVVLVGPSGCGKSTTLRMIAGLEDISDGDIMIGGDIVNDVPPKDRDIAMVFQNYALYPHMTVAENMSLGLRLKRYPKAEIKQRVLEAAKLLDLEPYLDRKPARLSGGQRQRVALGRAIVRDPAVFLLDEPLSNLDAHLRVQMRAEILRVHRAVTATAVYVTHDQVEALTMGDRIAVMNAGRIHQVGTPDELYDFPVDRFVASFIGTPAMGFIECRIARSQARTELVAEGTRIRAGDAHANVLLHSDSRDVTVGIRPERLALASPDEGQTSDVAIRGRVEAVEMLGSEQYVHVVVDGGAVTARVPRSQRVRAEDNVTLKADAQDVHLFERATGLALR